jgi:hypothetical protein
VTRYFRIAFVAAVGRNDVTFLDAQRRLLSVSVRVRGANWLSFTLVSPGSW